MAHNLEESRGLAVFGDSHAQYCFDAIDGAQVNWLGPVTMHRAGRDKAWFLRDWTAPKLDTDVVLVFGEIDVRCHLGRIADSTHRSREQVCTKTVNAFLDAIVESMPEIGTGRVVVSCVPPPNDGPGLTNSDFPVYGTWTDRAKTTRILNSLLEDGAGRRGLLFLDFSAHYSTPDGFLVAALSDGSVHIGRPHTAEIVSKLSKLLNRPLRRKTMEQVSGSSEQVTPEWDRAESVRPLSIIQRLGRLLRSGSDTDNSHPEVRVTEIPVVDSDAETKKEEILQPFMFDRYHLHDGEIELRDGSLVLSNGGAPWSYIASWGNSLPIESASGRGLRVEAIVTVEAGTPEFGIVAHDFATFVDVVRFKHGTQRVTLEAPDATAARALVLRVGQEPTRPIVAISDLRSHAIEGARTRQRGFLAKSAIDDLKAKISRDDPLIVDVGANIGDTVAHFVAAFPEARIWALEPHPETFLELKRRVANYRQVQAKNVALSNRSGSATMYSYTNSAINALSPVTAVASQLMEGQIVATREIVTPVQTLPEFLAQEQLDTIDILKLDTQGHEEEILGAALNELTSGRVKYILSELIFCPLYERQASAGRLIAMLQKQGFKLFDFYDFVYDADQGLKWGDAVFEYVGA